MEISPYKFNKPGGDPKPDFVHVVSVQATCIKNSNIERLFSSLRHHAQIHIEVDITIEPILMKIFANYTQLKSMKY